MHCRRNAREMWYDVQDGARHTEPATKQCTHPQPHRHQHQQDKHPTPTPTPNPQPQPQPHPSSHPLPPCAGPGGSWPHPNYGSGGWGCCPCGVGVGVGVGVGWFAARVGLRLAGSSWWRLNWTPSRQSLLHCNQSGMKPTNVKHQRQTPNTRSKRPHQITYHHIRSPHHERSPDHQITRSPDHQITVRTCT